MDELKRSWLDKTFLCHKTFKNPFIHLMSHKILQIHILLPLLYNIELGDALVQELF